ncbi:hypothetical protein GP486_002157 [Trichoglossum hirsutum]|uniref:CHAT domain-containing protein n=1 Tax=Trichoglossum hirsutum TaxID=265104 RepID=A0A9P8RS02_9PEZI|nr:hypothetical protein GP486_002157 [Trichoglossum hirsutum]
MEEILPESTDSLESAAAKANNVHLINMMIKEQRRLMDLVPQSDPTALQLLNPHTLAYTRAGLAILEGLKSLSLSGDLTPPPSHEEMDILGDALADFRKNGSALGKHEPAGLFVQTVLSRLTEAEELYDEIRRDLLRRDGLVAARESLLFSGNSRVDVVYSLAVEFLWKTSEEAEYCEGNYLIVWEWIQKAKGRVLSEYLGAGPTIPASQVSRGKLSTLTVGLLEKEQILAFELLKISPTDRQPVRQELSELRAKWPRIRSCVTPWAIRPEITLVAVRPGFLNAWKLPTGPKDVEEIIQQLLSNHLPDQTTDLNREDATTTLRKLNVLVEPIVSISDPGDEVVLSPSGLLHNVPLHALEVDQQLFIRCNSVVYCHNLSGLRSNFLARQIYGERLSDYHERTSAKRAVILRDPETDNGREALRWLGEKLNTEVNIAGDCTKQTLKTAMADVDLLHFHGHTHFDPDDSLNHFVALSDGVPTSGDILELPKSPAPYHVSLLTVRAACLAPPKRTMSWG